MVGPLGKVWQFLVETKHELHARPSAHGSRTPDGQGRAAAQTGCGAAAPGTLLSGNHRPTTDTSASVDQPQGSSATWKKPSLKGHTANECGHRVEKPESGARVGGWRTVPPG